VHVVRDAQLADQLLHPLLHVQLLAGAHALVVLATACDNS
jgi:hypothetical protein